MKDWKRPYIAIKDSKTSDYHMYRFNWNENQIVFVNQVVNWSKVNYMFYSWVEARGFYQAYTNVFARRTWRTFFNRNPYIAVYNWHARKYYCYHVNRKHKTLEFLGDEILWMRTTKVFDSIMYAYAYYHCERIV